jgi:hypothetical protein
MTRDLPETCQNLVRLGWPIRHDLRVHYRLYLNLGCRRRKDSRKQSQSALDAKVQSLFVTDLYPKTLDLPAF